MLENFDRLSAFIMSAGGFAWVGYLIVLLLAIFRFKSDLSSISSLSFWILSDLSAIGLTALMYVAIKAGDFSSVWWYPVFVANYAIFSGFIFVFHKYLNLKFSETSIVVFGLTAVLAAIDVVMHVDMMTILVLESFYHFAVPALKFLAVFLLAKASLKSRSDLC
jgi:hypothetical protein